MGKFRGAAVVDGDGGNAALRGDQSGLRRRAEAAAEEPCAAVDMREEVVLVLGRYARRIGSVGRDAVNAVLAHGDVELCG
jgi:hypothetical protein